MADEAEGLERYSMIVSHTVQYLERSDLLPLQALAKGYDPAKILIQVFCGILDKKRVAQLLEDTGELFPGAALIGTSTAGEIWNVTCLEQTILVNISLFTHTTVKSVLVAQNDNLVTAGEDISIDAFQLGMKAIIVFGCGLKDGKMINGEPLLTTLEQELKGVVIAGGHAGDDGKGETTFVFTENGITEHGVVAASLAGHRLQVNNAYNLSWVPIGKKFTITKAEGSRVYTINNKTPYEIYTHYLGQEVADNLPLSAVDFPLMIERDGIIMAIHATGVNDDGSFNYIHSFHAGEQVRFGFCHAEHLVLGAEAIHYEVKAHKPEAIYIYSCVSRKWILGEDISMELSSVGRLAPCAGFFSYGEYFYYDEGQACFFSQTMTTLSLVEKGSDLSMNENKASFLHFEEETRQFRNLRVLHRLVETSAKEIETINEELAQLASKDTLTGLANRRSFDEKLRRELSRLIRSGNCLSLIMLDVDYFKQFNDIYGHVAGDDCLRGIAQVIRTASKRTVDLAARYGGEEFACILPETDERGAQTIAERIRKNVEQLVIPHAGSSVGKYVTVSLGVLTIVGKSTDITENVVDKCDNLLYQAKQNGRNTTVCAVLTI